MREPPATAISQRLLLSMLASGGRKASAADLVNWRKNGLLPAMNSHGTGPARGKIHCWHEVDILARAELIHDTIRQYGRNDMVLLILFLSGFDVPLPQLRRAWSFRCRLRKAPAIRPMPVTSRPSGGQSGDPLLQAAVAIGAAVETDHQVRMIFLLERALAKLGYPKRATNIPLLRVMMAMETALDGSDLVRAAPDHDIRQAQRHLALALDFLRDCAVEEERSSLVAMFGPSLFALILTLLRSDQGVMLDRATARIKEAFRPAAGPASGTAYRLPPRQAGLRVSGSAAP